MAVFANIPSSLSENSTDGSELSKEDSPENSTLGKSFLEDADLVGNRNVWFFTCIFSRLLISRLLVENLEMIFFLNNKMLEVTIRDRRYTYTFK